MNKILFISVCCLLSIASIAQQRNELSLEDFDNILIDGVSMGSIDSIHGNEADLKAGMQRLFPKFKFQVRTEEELGAPYKQRGFFR